MNPNEVSGNAQLQQLVESRFDEMRSHFVEEATARTPGGNDAVVIKPAGC